MPSKFSLLGSIIACVITWYVLRIDGLIPTIIAAVIGGAVGEIAGRVLVASKKEISIERISVINIMRRVSLTPPPRRLLFVGVTLVIIAFLLFPFLDHAVEILSGPSEIHLGKSGAELAQVSFGKFLWIIPLIAVLALFIQGKWGGPVWMILGTLGFIITLRVSEEYFEEYMALLSSFYMATGVNMNLIGKISPGYGFWCTLAGYIVIFGSGIWDLIVQRKIKSEHKYGKES